MNYILNHLSQDKVNSNQANLQKTEAIKLEFKNLYSFRSKHKNNSSI